MLKKSLLILSIIFCILCVSNVCFASNTAGNMKNGVSTATNTVIDGASNLAHDVKNGIGNAENGIEGALSMNNMRTNMNDNNIDTTGYTATRTATTGAMGTSSSTMWIWAIVAIAAVVIVGLVWYYGSQNRVD